MPSILTTIVPVYNEARTLTTIMDRIGRSLPEAQVIYVNDGSTDDSLAILHAHARPEDVILNKENGGKGSAVRLALEKAEGAYTIIQDADVEYDPEQIPHLLAEAQTHPGTAVFGSRFLRKNPNIYKRFLWGNKLLTLCMNMLFGSRLTDSYTCYKLLPTALFRELDIRSNGFEMEAEICAKCVRHRIAICEVPIRYSPRTLSEGKKIGWKDAYKGFLTMLTIRMTAGRIGNYRKNS